MRRRAHGASPPAVGGCCAPLNVLLSLPPLPPPTIRAGARSPLRAPVTQPLVTLHSPSAFDPDLPGCPHLVWDLSEQREAEFSRHSGARDVGFVVMNLDMSDPRQRQGAIGQQPRGRRRQAPPGKPRWIE